MCFLVSSLSLEDTSEQRSKPSPKMNQALTPKTYIKQHVVVVSTYIILYPRSLMLKTFIYPQRNHQPG